jgi:hypothetical protein
MEVDPIIRDLGVSALQTRPQETCSSTHHLRYKHMGLILVLTLVLMLASQKIFLWPSLLPQLLAITVSAPFANIKEKRSK